MTLVMIYLGDMRKKIFKVLINGKTDLEGHASLSCLVMTDSWWQRSTKFSMIEWACGTSRLISGSSSYTRWKPYMGEIAI